MIYTSSVSTNEMARIGTYAYHWIVDAKSTQIERFQPEVARAPHAQILYESRTTRKEAVNGAVNGIPARHTIQWAITLLRCAVALYHQRSLGLVNRKQEWFNPANPRINQMNIYIILCVCEKERQNGVQPSDMCPRLLH